MAGPRDEISPGVAVVGAKLPMGKTDDGVVEVKLPMGRIAEEPPSDEMPSGPRAAVVGPVVELVKVERVVVGLVKTDPNAGADPNGTDGVDDGKTAPS